MFDGDMSAYMGVFLYEAEEQLRILENEVLKLEQKTGNEEAAERIETIFRAAHTLKGSSGAMGFEPINRLTHKLENVFDLLRRRELRADAALIDMILQTVDQLKRMKDDLASGSMLPEPPEDLIRTLEGLAAGSLSGDLPVQTALDDPDFGAELAAAASAGELLQLDGYQKDIVCQAFAADQAVVAVFVRIERTAVMKSARSLLIHNNLKELGEIIASAPPIEAMEDDSTFSGTLVFVLVTTGTRQQIIHVVNQISEIETVNLSYLTRDNLHAYCLPDDARHPHDAIAQPAQADDRQTSSSKVKSSQTVRVDVGRLEHLLNLVGELIIDQTRLSQFRTRLEDNLNNHELLEDLTDIASRLGSVVNELQEGMMKTRMLPIDQLFNRFPRMVRDLAQRSNKQVELIIDGKETELDRTLIEEISDPILHLLRNCIDHGLEAPERRKHLGKPPAGKLILKAEHEENRIVITMSDDGRGIDVGKIKRTAVERGMIEEAAAARLDTREALQLIFLPGFSTAEQVTDLSGRGVGMDIVKSHIEKLNGMIDIRTAVGEGTTFTIKLPLTLAVNRSLLVRIGSRSYAIPLSNVVEIIRQTPDNVKIAGNREVAVVRGRILPLVRPHRRLDECPPAEEGKSDIVVVGLAEKRVALMVDRTLGNQEIVIKSLGDYIGTPKYIAGATITGDGGLMLILDLNALIREEGTNKLEETEKKLSDRNAEPFVMFKLGDEQFAVSIRQVQSIIEVPAITPMVHASPELLGVIRLRGSLIPIVNAHRRLGLPASPGSKASRIMIMDLGQRTIGMIVDRVNQIVRIPEDRIEAARDGAIRLRSQFVRGIYHSQDVLGTVLDAVRVLSSPELDPEAGSLPLHSTND